MKDLQAVLFDLDGTLIDSEYFYFSNWSPVLAEHFDLHITYAVNKVAETAVCAYSRFYRLHE